MLTQIYYLLFGLVAIAGGAIGYARAKSKASLIAGSASGALLIIAGLLSPSVPGFILALIVSILLIAHFGRSYAAKKKPMPAIPMIVLSGICIVLTAIAWHTR
ncbi:MAG TPA: TMEM14 family protein [Chthoniobacterales bacterium]|jgi:uncharacterized membrane protein (UPF0136 family)|nr:TMEM14 family protein [Chthoniobacterales bacterium]